MDLFDTSNYDVQLLTKLPPLQPSAALRREQCATAVERRAAWRLGTMGGVGAHDPWATAKHASGVRRTLTPEGRAPPILDLRRAKSTVESRMLDRTLRSSGQGKGRLRAHKEVPMSTGQLAMLAHILEEGRGRHVQPHPHHHA